MAVRGHVTPFVPQMLTFYADVTTKRRGTVRVRVEIDARDVVNTLAEKAALNLTGRAGEYDRRLRAKVHSTLTPPAASPLGRRDALISRDQLPDAAPCRICGAATHAAEDCPTRF